MNYWVLFIILTTTLSCNSNKDMYKSFEKGNTISERTEIISDTIKEILINSKEINIFQGGLQSLEEGQKKENYIFGQFVGKKYSYDVVWVLNKPYDERIKEEISVTEIYGLIGKKSIVSKKFKTFLFYLPLVSVEDPLLDDPYIFPCEIDVFLIEGSLATKFKGSYKVNTWEEYIQLQYKSIFE